MRDYLIVMDKQLTQYLPMSKKHWRTLADCSNFQSQNAHIYGYVFHDTNGKNHGQTVKRTSLDTENHDKNGYAKLYDDNNIFMTNVDNDNSDTTYTNMRNM